MINSQIDHIQNILTLKVILKFHLMYHLILILYYTTYIILYLLPANCYDCKVAKKNKNSTLSEAKSTRIRFSKIDTYL